MLNGVRTEAVDVEGPGQEIARTLYNRERCSLKTELSMLSFY